MHLRLARCHVSVMQSGSIEPILTVFCVESPDQRRYHRRHKSDVTRKVARPNKPAHKHLK
jgi:hypothetical protein